MSARVAAALVLALAAAFLFALSNVLEQREAEQVPVEEVLRPGLLRKLARRPLWLAGLVSDVGGYACHAAALAFGSLVFVQPLLVTGLLFALALRALITGQRLRREDVVAAALLSAGLAVFLVGVSPHGGRVQAPAARWLVAGPVIVVVVAVFVAAGRQATGPRRALYLGLAAGISFGVSAALTKTFVHLLGDGVFAMLGHWEPYGLAVASLVGFVLMQSSFQAGSLAASVAALEIAEPVVAAAIGLGLLNERIDTHGVVSRLGVAVAVGAMFVGVLALSRSSEEATARRRAGRPEAGR
jgi:drug/metabolite transporter (DMT)-like permease